MQFAADAYVNEMGITTQHCIRGTSVLSFATESKPNGIAQPAGCDDLGPGGPGLPPAAISAHDGQGAASAAAFASLSADNQKALLTFLQSL